MRACTFHWIQRWERASRSRPNSLVLLFSVRDHRLPRADRPALAGTLGPSGCGPAAQLQPECALSLLEPAERLAGDLVVAVLLQVPAGRCVFERSVGIGDGAAFPVLLDPLDGLPVGTMFPGLPCWRSRSRPLCCAGEPVRSAVGCRAMRRGGPTTGGCSPTASGRSTAALRRGSSGGTGTSPVPRALDFDARPGFPGYDKRWH